MSDEETLYSIGEASEQTDLPESTIRFYHREFSDYLSIDRGDNNQRLFTDDNLKDLEYIRFLIKREDFRSKDQDRQTNESEKESTDSNGSESVENLRDKIEQLQEDMNEFREMIDQQRNEMQQIREDQENILKLLDMNLQRYNELVDNLSL